MDIKKMTAYITKELTNSFSKNLQSLNAFRGILTGNSLKKQLLQFPECKKILEGFRKIEETLEYKYISEGISSGGPSTSIACPAELERRKSVNSLRTSNALTVKEANYILEECKRREIHISPEALEGYRLVVAYGQ
jgi:hypothetical protein